jgi:chromosome partitioning protein
LIMQTLCIGSSKGGAGKSTIAAALAVAATQDGLRVGLIDVDPQQSLADWWIDRGEPDNPMLVTWGKSRTIRYLPTALEKMATAGFDLAIIDTPPAIMGIIEEAVAVADLVVIPNQPSAADLAGNEAVVDLVNEAGKDFVFVVNRVEPRGDAHLPQTMAILKSMGPTIAAVFSNRMPFRTSLGVGKSGAELDGKARDEVAGVWTELKKHLRRQARRVA